ncbi:MAG: DUF3299 domain-containing protein [Planctomycetales bacterium]|nr:DUF3299 domain-containing protein [Planctomycetales bacterium]
MSSISQDLADQSVDGYSQPYAAPQSDAEYHPYRAISKAAVTSLAIGLLSFSALVFPELLILPSLGAVLGVIAIRNLRRYPEELTGRIPAMLGLVLCSLLLVGGSALHAAIYATEVPDGYERISYNSLKSAPGKPDFPPGEALALDGKKVFLKGYIHPSVDGMGAIKKFVLVPDLGTCCFGGQPPLTHMIEVSVKSHDVVEYSQRKRRLAGVLHVDRQLKPISGLNGVYYQLDAEHVK